LLLVALLIAPASNFTLPRPRHRGATVDLPHAIAAEIAVICRALQLPRVLTATAAVAFGIVSPAAVELTLQCRAARLRSPGVRAAERRRSSGPWVPGGVPTGVVVPHPEAVSISALRRQCESMRRRDGTSGSPMGQAPESLRAPAVATGWLHCAGVRLLGAEAYLPQIRAGADSSAPIPDLIDHAVLPAIGMTSAGRIMPAFRMPQRTGASHLC